MTTALATTLAVALAVPVPPSMIGPVEAALDREAHRLVLTAQPANRTVEWNELRNLRPGAQLDVWVGSRFRSATFVLADESALIITSRSGNHREAIPRDRIRQIDEVTTTVDRIGPTTGVIVGSVIGVLSFFGIALNDTPCAHYDCTGRTTLMWSVAVGAPVGGGILGYYAGRHVARRIVYRVP